MLDFKEVNNISGINYLSIPHIPIIFLVDTSGSMMSSSKNHPIEEVNKFLANFKDIVYPYRDSIDISVISFNYTAQIEQDWEPLCDFVPCSLSAGGTTVTGQAIEMALDQWRKRRRFYQELGVRCYCPSIFMITDGMATDDVDRVYERLSEEKERRKLQLWSLGIEGCDEEQLKKISDKTFRIDDESVSVQDALSWIVNTRISLLTDTHAAIYQDGIKKIELPTGVFLLDKEFEW